MNQDAGAVSIPYQTTAVATPTTGAWAISGAVFIANTQSGILNVQRMMVQTSTGLQAFPQCALTTPYVATDGLVWGGANAGGSITTGVNPLVNNGVVGVGNVGVVTGIGTFSQFILPEFASATCRFNLTMTTVRGTAGARGRQGEGCVREACTLACALACASACACGCAPSAAAWDCAGGALRP